jgi:hypothetical protein
MCDGVDKQHDHRFVCDAGNGGHYRNVRTLGKELRSEDGEYRCDITGAHPKP